jgi:hypothetical protein
MLEPEWIVVRLAAKELIDGTLPAFTVMVCVDVTEPAVLDAVRV